RATAQAAYRELIQKFPDTDKGLLVAINPGVSEVEGSAQTAQSIEEAPPLANFPNPFNPSTTIQFKVTNPGKVSLKVYDVLGREVATLVNEHKEAGLHAVQWDAGSLPSGMYFYRLEANGKSYVQKMLLVR
ncbi:MAG TPA: T9SS type A sorting domain-containing protein, partial [Bacteroidota bacterium]|nr:T9SS type A sorting domain-containing protein [Bacteroidota bacterium]